MICWNEHFQSYRECISISTVAVFCFNVLKHLPSSTYFKFVQVSLTTQATQGGNSSADLDLLDLSSATPVPFEATFAPPSRESPNKNSNPGSDLDAFFNAPTNSSANINNDAFFQTNSSPSHPILSPHLFSPTVNSNSSAFAAAELVGQNVGANNRKSIVPEDSSAVANLGKTGLLNLVDCLELEKPESTGNTASFLTATSDALDTKQPTSHAWTHAAVSPGIPTTPNHPNAAGSAPVGAMPNSTNSSATSNWGAIPSPNTLAASSTIISPNTTSAAPVPPAPIKNYNALDEAFEEQNNPKPDDAFSFVSDLMKKKDG